MAKKTAKPELDADGKPVLDESPKGISSAQTSAAAELRAFVNAAQANHDASLASVAKLSNDRRERNKFFYLGGEYGFKSPEYKAVNAIPFRKQKL